MLIVIPALVKPDSELGWVYACSKCKLVNYGGPVSKCENCGEVVDHHIPAIPYNGKIYWLKKEMPKNEKHISGQMSFTDLLNGGDTNDGL